MEPESHDRSPESQWGPGHLPSPGRALLSHDSNGGWWQGLQRREKRERLRLDEVGCGSSVRTGTTAARPLRGSVAVGSDLTSLCRRMPATRSAKGTGVSVALSPSVRSGGTGLERVLPLPRTSPPQPPRVSRPCSNSQHHMGFPSQDALLENRLCPLGLTLPRGSPGLSRAGVLGTVDRHP